MTFDRVIELFRMELELEIAKTPTGPDRDMLTDVNISCVRLQDHRKKQAVA